MSFSLPLDQFTLPAPGEDDEEDDHDPSFEDLQSEWMSNDDINDAISHARQPKTQAGYDAALNRFTTWTAQFVDDSAMVKALMYEDDENDGLLTFDATKLAKSFEKNMNVYFNYTLSYQKKMNEKQKSGLGHIKVLRTALSDFFMSNSVELSKVALAKLTKWQKSRIRDDMTAKMKDIDPVKFSNARSSLPM